MANVKQIRETLLKQKLMENTMPWVKMQVDADKRREEQREERKSLRAEVVAKNAREAMTRAMTAERRVEILSAKVEMRGRETPHELRAKLQDLFAKYDFSPAEELVEMVKNPSHPFYVLDAALRVRILSELQAYVMPKLRSTEIQGKVEHGHHITILRIGDDGSQVREALAKTTTSQILDVGGARG